MGCRDLTFTAALGGPEAGAVKLPVCTTHLGMSPPQISVHLILIAHLVGGPDIPP